MIESTSSSDRAARASALSADAQRPAAPRMQSGSDSLSTDKAAQLQSALEAVPEIRPEVVARGQALAADPSYPSASIVRSVASLIVNSPDLSEDES
jgi:hypothetical protein